MVLHCSVIVEYNQSAITAVCVANFTNTAEVIFITTLANAFCSCVFTVINLYMFWMWYRMSTASCKFKQPC